MSLRELSVSSDARCSVCQRPAAEGAAVDGKCFCRPHAELVLWLRAEERLWEIVRFMGDTAVEEIAEEVLTRPYGDTVFPHIAS